MMAKTERFEMRLDQEVLDIVDNWRNDQSDFPSRAEAIRRLVDAGLSSTSRSQVKLSDGEKLTISMLCELFKHLKIKSEIDPKFVESAITGGHYWGLSWSYHGLFHGHEDNEKNVSEVVDILDMWSFLESGFGKLSKKDKARVGKEAEPFGKNVTFHGFDGNNETEHMGIARFLIDKLERFSSFEGRELNSHSPSVEVYRRMFRVFEPMRRDLLGIELNASQIIEILNARTHPEYRD